MLQISIHGRGGEKDTTFAKAVGCARKNVRAEPLIWKKNGNDFSS